MMEVSIVIPAYNEQRYVQRCIDSLLKQTVKSEIIFVDDGSTDNTRSILRNAAKLHKNIRVYFRNHGGPGAARNFGARKAKGKILVLVDADMVFDKNYIKNLISPVAKGKAVGTFHDTELVANKENVWARAWCLNRQENVGKYSGVFRAVVRKKFLAAGGFDPSKGYFDDALGGLGKSLRAHAVCYHNNPENLSEVFKHSMWVGRSLAKTRKTFAFAARGSFVVVFFSIALAFFGLWWSLVGVLGLGIVSWLFISIKRTLPRLHEGYPEYIVTIPILWLFRLAGYYIGALE